MSSKGRGVYCNFSIPNHHLQFFDPKPPSVIFRSQTTECNFSIPNRNSSKSERSKIILFELSNFVYFIAPLSNFIYYSSNGLFRLRIISTREPKECNEILRIISAKELYTCRNLQLYDHVYWISATLDLLYCTVHWNIDRIWVPRCWCMTVFNES